MPSDSLPSGAHQPDRMHQHFSRRDHLLILSFSDRPSLLSLSLTARAFAPCAEPYIWRNLDLRKPAKSDDEDSDVPEPVAAKKAGRRRSKASRKKLRLKLLLQSREAARRRLKMLLEAGNGRKWGMAESLKVQPESVTAHLIVSVLDNVSPNLRRLRLDPSDDDTFPTAASFDFKLIGAGLHLPSLTHIHFSEEATQFNGVIPLLCRYSPNLKSLAFTLVEESEEMSKLGIRRGESCETGGTASVWDTAGI